MPRKCSICAHERCGEINAAIVAGTLSNYEIAAIYGVSERAIRRHEANHLPAHLAQAHAAAEVAQADDLLAELRKLQQITLGILGRTGSAGDNRTALVAVREARGNLELMAEMLGELDRRAQINILIAPEWIAVRAVLLSALQPYPDARAAVAAALLQAEGEANGHR